MKSDIDEVALQGIEFWSNVCDEEMDLAIEATEVKPAFCLLCNKGLIWIVKFLKAGFCFGFRVSISPHVALMTRLLP